MTSFDHTSLARWRQQPISFIEGVLNDPETKKPFVLLDAERRFLEHAFKLDDDGRLLYPEQVYSCPKKSGKTTYAALHTLTLILLHGGAYPEATCCANDYEQAQGRVFMMIKRIIEASPLLRAAAKITESRITFPALDITITAIPSSFAGAAGGNQNIAVFDELWGFTSERSRRLWDELVPPPTRKTGCRLTTTYAGFVAESTLLEELYHRALQQQLIGPDLYGGGGILMFWSHTPIAPWQDERWLAEMRRSLRPNAYLRLVENRFVSSETSFVNLGDWDACVQPAVTPVMHDKNLHVWIGVDASVKHDSTAIVAVTFDKKTQVARLVQHRIFTPTPGNPITFDDIEQTILDWSKRYLVRKISFDPNQLISTAQRLSKTHHLPIEEFPQTVSNLTMATENLFQLIQNRSIALYPAADMRLAISRAVIVESSRGRRIAKDRRSHRIDVVVALSMAALAAVKGQDEHFYSLWGNAFSTEDEPAPSLVPKRKHPQFTDEEYDRITGPVSLIPADVRRMHK
jgi:phage terminase large subunit-like protein